MTKDAKDRLKDMKGGKGKTSPAPSSSLIDRINAITEERNKEKPHWTDRAKATGATGEEQHVETVRVPKPEHRPSAKTLAKFKGKLNER